MFDTINEHVDVLAGFSFKEGLVTVSPHVMKWRNRRYRLETMGLYHPAKRGTESIHVFEFTSGSSKFRLELNSDTLEWVLTEAYYDYST